MPVPEIDNNPQVQIAERVQKSFSMYRQSEQLLDRAKQAVEIAIEVNEDTAVEWLAEVGRNE